MRQLENKRIVIIGGTTGIGHSALKAFISNGAQVVAMGLEGEELPAIENSSYYFGDITVEGQAEQAIQQCVDKFGGFDALFHVAGGSGRKWGDGPLHEITLEGWRKTLDLNLTSVMLSNRAAIRHFINQDKPGAILNTSTVLAYSPSPKHFYTHSYAAAKAGIIGFSKSIASYYSQHNIRVNVIAPALTNTPMAKRSAQQADIQTFIKTKQPLDGGRIANASDIDGAACYFLSDQAAFTTGQILAVDGGWCISDGQHNT